MCFGERKPLPCDFMELCFGFTLHVVRGREGKVVVGTRLLPIGIAMRRTHMTALKSHLQV